MRILSCAFALSLFSLAAAAQPFEAGPPGTIVGSSMADLPLSGAPQIRGTRIPNAPVFGDTVEERAWGRNFDDSHLRPRVRSRAGGVFGSEAEAMRGRPGLDPARAGAFARSGPAAIGQSPVTRPSLAGGRARIR